MLGIVLTQNHTLGLRMLQLYFPNLFLLHFRIEGSNVYFQCIYILDNYYNHKNAFALQHLHSHLQAVLQYLKSDHLQSLMEIQTYHDLNQGDVRLYGCNIFSNHSILISDLSISE